MGGVVLRSTDVPKADRFDWWVDLVTRDLAPTYITTEHRDDFRATAVALELGSVHASALSFQTLQSRRTPRLIQRSDPELWELGYVVGGVMGIEQDRNVAQLQAGGLVLYDTSRQFETRVAEDGRIIILHVPKTAVPVPDQVMRNLLAHRLPTYGSGSLLAGFLRDLAGVRLEGWEAEQTGAAALHLALAFLSGLANRERLLPARTRQTTLLYKAKAFIERHLSEPGLSPQVVADAQGISVRYLHHLFHEEKHTVGSFIRGRRLERCRADLTAPGLMPRPVGMIGARWGFTDPAIFNRAFKAAYGIPPGEYRTRATLDRDHTAV
ncbi:helix-turn-helix domain-containing protein [Kitasatospora sp. NPDC057936]|uniref:helix-turn-helix domain-containing protein n=1 Tax=Kitasatospora sp. NPDC057936 TaxID=3346283 RepID=UPI0036DDE474